MTFPLGDIFTHQTIRELVRGGTVQVADGSDSPSATAPAEPETGVFALVSPAERERLATEHDDAYPMSVLQLGMVYHAELTGNPATYHNVTAHRIDAPLDVAALTEAFAGLVARHPVLRTAFDLGASGTPLQLVRRAVAVDVPVTDLSGFAEAEQRIRVDALVAAELATPFDWTAPPLVRLQVARTGNTGFDLLVAEFHAVLDGWSLHLFLHELLADYTALAAGKWPATAWRRCRTGDSSSWSGTPARTGTAAGSGWTGSRASVRCGWPTANRTGSPSGATSRCPRAPPRRPPGSLPRSACR